MEDKLNEIDAANLEKAKAAAKRFEKEGGDERFRDFVATRADLSLTWVTRAVNRGSCG